MSSEILHITGAPEMFTALNRRSLQVNHVVGHFPFLHIRCYQKCLGCVGGKHSIVANRRTSLNKLAIGLNLKYISDFSGFSASVGLRERQINEAKCRKKLTLNFISYELSICLLERIRFGCRDNDDKYCQKYDDTFNQAECQEVEGVINRGPKKCFKIE